MKSETFGLPPSGKAVSARQGQLFQPVNIALSGLGGVQQPLRYHQSGFPVSGGQIETAPFGLNKGC